MVEFTEATKRTQMMKTMTKDTLIASLREVVSLVRKAKKTKGLVTMI